MTTFPQTVSLLPARAQRLARRVLETQPAQSDAVKIASGVLFLIDRGILSSEVELSIEDYSILLKSTT